MRDQSLTTPRTNFTLTPTRRRMRLALLLAVVLFFLSLMREGTIVTETPPVLKGCVVLAGLICGAVAAFHIFIQAEAFGDRKSVLVLAGMPVFTAVLFMYGFRLAEEALGFVNFAATIRIIPAEVTGASNGKSGPMAYATPFSGAREINLRATPELLIKLDPVRVPGRDCLLIPLETGRFGIQRTFSPIPFGRKIGVEALQPCPAVRALRDANFVSSFS